MNAKVKSQNCTISFRADKNIRDCVVRIAACEGIDLSTSMRIFLQNTAETGKFPFEVPKEEKKAINKVSGVLLQNELLFSLQSTNIVLVHQKSGVDYPIGVCERNIRDQDSRQMSVEEGNRFMKDLLALSKERDGEGAIAFVWSIGGDPQEVSIIPLKTFRSGTPCPAFVAKQRNGEDYRVWIRKEDRAWLQQTTQQLLDRLVAGK